MNLVNTEALVHQHCQQQPQPLPQMKWRSKKKHAVIFAEDDRTFQPSSILDSTLDLDLESKDPISYPRYPDWSAFLMLPSQPMYKVKGIPLKSMTAYLFNSVYPDSHSHPLAFLIFVWSLVSVPLPYIWTGEICFLHSVFKNLLISYYMPATNSPKSVIAMLSYWGRKLMVVRGWEGEESSDK